MGDILGSVHEKSGQSTQLRRCAAHGIASDGTTERAMAMSQAKEHANSTRIGVSVGGFCCAQLCLLCR